MAKSKQDLLGMQKRLETLLTADIPMIMDVVRDTSPDIGDRLRLVLSDYGVFLELNIRDIEATERTTPLI